MVPVTTNQTIIRFPSILSINHCENHHEKLPIVNHDEKLGISLAMQRMSIWQCGIHRLHNPHGIFVGKPYPNGMFLLHWLAFPQ